jgi:DNA polymerase III subunit delta'
LNTVLPWQEQQWHQITQQARSGRLAHAYLVSGLPDSGRYQFAKALSEWLLCESPTDSACGNCSQCLLFRGGNHPDVYEIVPEDNSKSIKIDQIRLASQFVYQTSNQLNATKIIIIRPIRAVGTAAANALLKNLEEPPGKVLYLLISEPTGVLLSTVRSRCQLLSLAMPDTEQAIAWMRTQTTAPESELRAAIALVPGQPMLALTLFELGIPAWREILLEKLRLLEHGAHSISELAKFCSSQPPSYAIELMNQRVADRIRKLSLHPDYDGQGPVRALIVAMLDFQRELGRVNAQLSSTANPNVQLALEHVFLQWKDCTGRRHGIEEPLSGISGGSTAAN